MENSGPLQACNGVTLPLHLPVMRRTLALEKAEHDTNNNR